jgi:hypothetical protein
MDSSFFGLLRLDDVDAVSRHEGGVHFILAADLLALAAELGIVRP